MGEKYTGVCRSKNYLRGKHVCKQVVSSMLIMQVSECRTVLTLPPFGLCVIKTRDSVLLRRLPIFTSDLGGLATKTMCLKKYLSEADFGRQEHQSEHSQSSKDTEMHHPDISPGMIGSIRPNTRNTKSNQGSASIMVEPSALQPPNSSPTPPAGCIKSRTQI